MIGIPIELAMRIAAAKDLLAANASAVLPLLERRKIWAALGPFETTDSRTAKGQGHRRRSLLAQLSVKRVLPMWYSVYPNDDRPYKLLMLAQQVISGDVAMQHAEAAYSSSWSEMDDLAAGSSTMQIYNLVGYAACAALSTALYDEDFGNSTTDEQLDPDQWDASFIASIVYADGAPWHERSNLGRRREFWQWYLLSAASESYVSVVF